MDKVVDLRQKNPSDDGKPVPEATPPSFNFPEETEGAENGTPRLISWSGPLYYHNPDMKAVWITFGIFMAAAVLFQIFQGNIITTVLMAMLGAMILIHAKKKPKDSGEVMISPLGIRIDEREYKYNEIKSFWIAYQPEYDIKELSLQLKKWYMPYLKISIGEQNPVRLRTLLVQFIPEIEHIDGLGEVIARRLGL